MTEWTYTQSGSMHLDRVGPAPLWAIILLLGINTTGCALLKPPPSPAVAPHSCTAEKNEIGRLRQLLAEKESLIRSQQANQQEQAKELLETTAQASRTKIKLRRMATQTDAASTLAEVEVAMEALKSTQNTAQQHTMQAHAQSLLDAANAAYLQDDFATAVDLATQSWQMINMVQGLRAGKEGSKHRVTTFFETPIQLRTRSDCNLRQQPRSTAPILRVLKKDSPLIALSYQGNWLRIQTEDGHTGWLFNRVVDVRPDKP